VRQLAAKGFQVVLTARDPNAGAQAASAIKGEVTFLALDVADDQSIAQAVDKFAKMSDRLDVLVNNAAIYPDEAVDILNVSRELLTKTFQTNTFGAIRMIQAFLPHLAQADHARVINLSSGYGELDGLSANVPSYCLSKLTLNGATIMFDQALRQRGIAVNSVCPGWVRTDMGGPNATKSIEEGADTTVWLATDAPQFALRKILPRTPRNFLVTRKKQKFNRRTQRGGAATKGNPHANMQETPRQKISTTRPRRPQRQNTLDTRWQSSGSNLCGLCGLAVNCSVLSAWHRCAAALR